MNYKYIQNNMTANKKYRESSINVSSFNVIRYNVVI